MELYYILQRQYRNIKAAELKHKYSLLHKQQKNTIEDLFTPNASYVLFITTDINAGTREYEDNFLKQAKHIILLRRISYGERPDIIFSLTNNDTKREMFLTCNELQSVFERKYSEIYVNSLVHVTNIKKILHLVCCNKEKYPETKVRYFVHDFHCVCLIVNLFVNGHYCKINCTKEYCKLYLADNIIDISKWRSMWGLFFANVDEVRCFSNSSKNIFCSVYPMVPKNVVTVIPHDTTHIFYHPIKYNEKDPLHIGVIGNIRPEFKGRNVIKELIKRFGDEVPITLIGSSFNDLKIRKKKVEYLGRYNQKELPDLVIKSHVNFIIFPSLCPETFSYVISEIIAMNLPVICFDIGAQGERVEAYDKGVVCQNTEELFSYIEMRMNSGELM